MLDKPEKKPSYFCVAEDATGFIFEGGKWKRVKFDVNDSKYIIRPIKIGEAGFEDKSNPYAVYDLGEDFSRYRCSFLNDKIRCSIGVGEFNLSLTSGRFLQTYSAGYWDGKDDYNDTPHIKIGRCSLI